MSIRKIAFKLGQFGSASNVPVEFEEHKFLKAFPAYTREALQSEDAEWAHIMLAIETGLNAGEAAASKR